MLFRLGDLGIGVSHDSNEHVEESNLGHESCNKEEDPHDDIVLSIVGIQSLKLSQREEILVQENVEDGAAKVPDNQGVFALEIWVFDKLLLSWLPVVV